MYFGNLLLSPQVLNLFLQSWLKHSPKIPVQFFTSLSISSIYNSLYIILCICAFSPSPHTHLSVFSLPPPFSSPQPTVFLSPSYFCSYVIILSLFYSQLINSWTQLLVLFNFCCFQFYNLFLLYIYNFLPCSFFMCDEFPKARVLFHHASHLTLASS